MNRRGVLRFVRLGALLFLVVVAALLVRTYDTFTIPETDASLAPRYPGGSMVVGRAVDETDVLPRDADVVWTMERDGVVYARYGRLRGLPGDVFGLVDGKMTVNGELIGPIPVRGPELGAVPEGHVCILANGPVDPRYADSRTLGFLPRAVVHAIIRFKLRG